MRRLPTTLSVLGARGGLRRVVLAYGLYDIVDIAIWVAIILYAFAEGGVTLVGVIAVVQLVPAALLGPALVGLCDRLPRGAMLVLSHAAVAAAAVLVAAAVGAGAPVPVVIACSALATIAISVVRPFHFASLPMLSRSPEQLVSANAVSSVADGFALFLGPVLAGVGVAVAGPGVVFVIAGVVSGVAALLCLGLGLGASPSAGGDEPGWRDAFGGVAMLWRDWAALALLLVLTTRFVLGGATDVLGVAYSEEVLGMGDSGAGLILGSLGIGGLIGGAVAAWPSARRRLAPVLAASGAVQGLAFALVAGIVLLAPAMVALAVSGIAAAVMMVAGRTLLQRTTDEVALARVFAVQEGVSLLGVALGAILAPPLVERLSPATAFVPFGVAVAVVSVAGFWLMRRLDARAVLHPIEVQLLRSVPFLAALPAYEVEQLAGDAEWLDVSPAQVVIRQGDVGDRFYVIAEGEFSVSIDGVPRPEPLRPGTGFGEVALLHAVPRTATVTAITAGRLLMLTAEDFLAAVTGNPEGHAAARSQAAEHLRGERR